MLKVLKNKCRFDAIEQKQYRVDSIDPTNYFVSISHSFVIIQSGQKFTSPAISGIAPR